MYELIQVSDNTYYIDCPAKAGIVRINDEEVILIDSGNDKDAGRKIRQILDKNNWKLKAIYNTHSNADHIGGNAYLKRQTGCAIYAPGIECSFTRHPILEPSFLYGGFPCKELRHKFLMAEESDAEYLSEDSLPDGMEIINLPGHFFSMVGFRTKDDVVFLADCLSSKETLEKYGITFIYDVASYIETLEKAKIMEGRLFIPAHAETTDDIKELATYNLGKVSEIADKISIYCTIAPHTPDEIIQHMFNEYKIKMSIEQYVLAGSTIKSYLSWLKDTGKLEIIIDDNMIKYKGIKQ